MAGRLLLCDFGTYNGLSSTVRSNDLSLPGCLERTIIEDHSRSHIEWHEAVTDAPYTISRTVKNARWMLVAGYAETSEFVACRISFHILTVNKPLLKILISALLSQCEKVGLVGKRWREHDF